MTIKEISFNDSGTYECNVDVASDLRSSYLTRIGVNVKRQYVKVETKNQVQKVIANTSVALDCAWWWPEKEKKEQENTLFSIEGKNEIEWKLNDSVTITEEYQQAKYEFLDNFNTLLRINSVELSDKYNNYTCTFKIKENHLRESKFIFDVGVIPFVSNQQVLKVNNSVRWLEKFESVQLECPLNGFPSPSISWHYNSNVIDSITSAHHIISNEDDMNNPSVIISTLKVINFEEFLQGVYYCNATNIFGSQVYQYRLELVSK